MAQFKNTFNVDLAGHNKPVPLRQMVAEGNNSANKIIVNVTENGEPVGLGGSCHGKVVRADGVTVLIDGTISGNTASVILDGNSYAVVGPLWISIEWSNGDDLTTLLKTYGYVENISTNSVIPAGDVLNIDTIIEMVQSFATGLYLSADDTIISGDGTASGIADHDDVVHNVLYRLQVTTKMSWLPSDYPSTAKIHYLIDYYLPFSGDDAVTEVIYDENMIVKWVRQKQPYGTFGNWNGFKDGRLQIKCQAGTDLIQSALSLAYWNGDADVILLAGEHIITSINGNGMDLGHNIRVIGEAGSIIKCHSSVDSQYFSVFYAGEGDFELIGVNIDASRIRYCVHDDPPSAVAGTPARHVYRECNMYIDNTQNSLWPNHQCIGGGMGLHTQIIIENCVFDGANPDSQLGLVSYHNNVESGAEGLIFIKDCQFKKAQGTARFGWYGTSTQVTPCYVVNCLLGTAPVIRAETSGSTSENMSLTTWGNVIAS